VNFNEAQVPNAEPMFDADAIAQFEHRATVEFAEVHDSMLANVRSEINAHENALEALRLRETALEASLVPFHASDAVSPFHQSARAQVDDRESI
jgi:hypothetical protein